MKELTYIIYIIFWESLVFYSAYVTIVEHGWSAWFLVLFFIMSGAAYPPERWIHGKGPKNE